MQIIDILEAKLRLLKLIEGVSRGEEIVISQLGHPIARLMPVCCPQPVRKPGALKGKMRIAEDFDAQLFSKMWIVHC